jgi:hypothetical protein
VKFAKYKKKAGFGSQVLSKDKVSGFGPLAAFRCFHQPSVFEITNFTPALAPAAASKPHACRRAVDIILCPTYDIILCPTYHMISYYAQQL